MKKIYLQFCGVLLTCVACSLDGLVNVSDPEIGSIVDPNYLKSREGALALLHNSLSEFKTSISYASRDIGVFTDELAAVPGDAAKEWTLIEARVENIDRSGKRGVYVPWYITLQKTRISAIQTRGLTKLLNRDELNFLYAATYAIEGFSTLMLAENFCSGVPLTSVSFDGKVEYSSPISTEGMLESAIALFDSALAVDHDSLKYNTLAKMGKARAYLNLGKYEDAVSASSELHENDKFEVVYTFQRTPGYTGTLNRNVFWTGEDALSFNWYDESHIVNNDGVNGLLWYNLPESIDPRVPVITEVEGGIPYVRPDKFAGDTRFPLVHSSQTKLIAAEYLLSKGDPGWLDILNEMRRSVNLVDTVDPGTAASRISLLFRERAYWLYLEGTRLSDMRRLVRQYRFDPLQVFPTGRYDRQRANYGIDFYGDAYVFIPDSDEFLYNHKYDGCIHKNP